MKENKKSQVDQMLRAVGEIVKSLKELPEELRSRTLKCAIDLLGKEGGGVELDRGNLKQSISLDIPRPEETSHDDIKQFIAEKKPKTDVERVACLAYYLFCHRKTSKFKTKDITQLNMEAAQVPFSNPSVAVDNAANVAEYLSQAGSGFKQITPRGEAVVKALPNRDKLRQVLDDFPRRRRRRKSNSSEK